ncbi:two-component sensor histidine kinase [Halarcobacter mediterraneus]|uniref:histidine kinase n=2 Tax=Halarcobacter mediterraneus TaxID=2023153 RepID=A0A4V1M1A7_9BACT|nr:two-component sensor histidine kinase [Halarcobacter mediterraneus]
MENISSQLSSKIIFAHMMDGKLEIENYLKMPQYKIAFYDKNKQKILGDFNGDVKLEKGFYQNDNKYILVDNSTFGHLGIFYTVIKNKQVFKLIEDIKKRVLLIFLMIYSLISFIAYFLAKLFIKPIQNEREKLNNFIKDTTHELNTPISAILMSSESDNLTKKQLERVKLAVHRISEIYSDLTYVFLEEKDENRVLHELELKALIEEQLKYFEVIALKRKITIHTELEEFNYKIDKNDFIRLFNNILSNAIKYNKKEGEVFITLKGSTLSIKDTGIGIENKKIDDIFSRYYRATKEQGGFGIGLNIVQNICKTYNIIFNVDSQIKVGTTFTFTF